MVKINIITCPTWGAVPPKMEPEWCARSTRIIFHHTAGHHSEISVPSNESLAEAMRYARDIQHFHMTPPPLGRGWNDTGQNFTVCRNGMILQGRWRTVVAIEARQMVISAHCPYYNNQIGIEHEHLGTEKMTPAQRESSARLQAWIAAQYGLTIVLPVDPHSAHYATACPANLIKDIPAIRSRAQQILKAEGR